MKFKLDEHWKNIEQKAEKITMTDYEVDYQDYIEVENLLSIIEDLIGEIEHLKEEKEAIEQDRNDNYRPIPVKEQVGYSEKDFY